MKPPGLCNDLVPIKDLRSNLASWVDAVAKDRRVLVVTQRGRASAVMIHPEVLDELYETQAVLKRVLLGLQEASGPLVEDAEVWREAEMVIRALEAGGRDEGGVDA